MRSLLHFSLLLSALLLAGDSSAMSASSTVGPAEADQEERWPVADEDGYYQAYKARNLLFLLLLRIAAIH